MTKGKMSDTPEAPHYEVFMQAEDQDLAYIRILEGPYKDIVYHYGIVSVGQEEEDGSVPLNYTYDITEGVLTEENTSGFEEPLNFTHINHHYLTINKSNYVINECNDACVDDIVIYDPSP